MANIPDVSKAIIPDHALGGGLLPTVHTRYLIDAGIVTFAVGLFAISLFLISEPDIAAVVRKVAGSAKNVAGDALLAAA